ncbi:MAG: DUF4147 domain-containing protein [Oscillospiraceae bacterium]|nr:DUF4147 domain-containing protein [Oscillospiraceae bacterium]
MGRITNIEALTGHGNIEGRRVLADIMDYGLTSVDPYDNTRELVRREGNLLIFDGLDFEAKGDPKSGKAIYDLDLLDRVYVFGIGKGIQRLTKALEDILGDYLTEGHVVAKHGDEVIMERMGVTLAGHPVPDKYCAIGCQKIVDIIEEAQLTENDLVITAIGNGVSSLLTLPWPEISLEDVTETTRLMQIEYGIGTGELNDIRINVDRLKGGRISRLIHPAKMVHLFGVAPGNPGSKEDDPSMSEFDNLLKNNHWLHTVSVDTSHTTALNVIEKYDTENKMPESIINFLKNFDMSKAPVSWQEYETFDTRLFGVMPKNRSSLARGMQRAKELGYTPYYLGWITVEANPAGIYMANLATAAEAGLSPLKPPCAIFTTGELLVTCGDNPGVGGRNQEYCLSGARRISGSKRIVMSGSDTDGTDGPGGEFHPDATAKGVTVLTGAIVDGYTMAECAKKNIDVYEALQNHATSAPLWEIDSGIAAIQNISIGDYACTIVMDHDG